MPAKKKKPAPRLGPQHKSFIKVPDELGGGRLSLYEIAQGLPELIPAASPKSLAGHEWVMVHFPSRHWAALKTMKEWESARSEIGKGHNPHNILPPKRSQKAVSKVGRAPARASSKTGQSKGSFTEVMPGMNFDQAMDHVFPVARLTREYERLLTAEEDVFAKDGRRIGSRPAFSTQFSALKALTEWRVGRPSEKEKPPEEKKRMSHDELIHWLETNEDAVEYMEEVVRRARMKQTAAKTKTAAPPPNTSAKP